MYELTYRVKNSGGAIVMQAPECCRYPPAVERTLLEAGYTIWLNGKKVTKKEVKERG